MFGPIFLVAPVLQPLSVAKSRSVYLPKLPAGELWVNYYSGATSNGGERLDVTVTLATFPLYQRQTREEYNRKLQLEAMAAVANAMTE